MKLININNRLKTIAGFVREGSVVADVGTDHAFLPIWLVQNNISTNVIATDINPAPCMKAERNVKLYGYEKNITIIQTDGLNGIEKYNPTDIIIAGMGGELIWGIIKDVKSENLNLILQPMTRVQLLRKLLTGNGFEIINERLSNDSNRTYQIMQVKYTGQNQIYTEAELLIGKHNIINKQDLFIKLLEKNIKSLEKKINGKSSANIDVTADKQILKQLRRLL